MRSVFNVLFRRRQVVLPTVWGWLLLIGLLVASVRGAAPHAFRWLAVDRPAPGARVLVVEGWLSPYELGQAVGAFRAGHYERVVTTGGPSHDWPETAAPLTYAHRAADFLVRHGIPADRVVPVPAPEARLDRTYVSAVQVREWIQRTGAPVPALDIFTAGAHARRSQMLYEMAFGPEVAIGAMTAALPVGDPDRWWTQSGTVKLVIGEALSTAWTVCCFWPPAPPGDGH